MNISDIMTVLHKWYTSIPSRHLFSWSKYLVDGVTTYIFLYCWVALSWACVATVWTHAGYSIDILHRYWSHSIDWRSWAQYDWGLYHKRYITLWDVRGDHIVTMKAIEPHMDYHALYMTWYRRIIRRFITPMDDVGPM